MGGRSCLRSEAPREASRCRQRRRSDADHGGARRRGRPPGAARARQARHDPAPAGAGVRRLRALPRADRGRARQSVRRHPQSIADALELPIIELLPHSNGRTAAMTHILDVLGRLPPSELPAVAELIESRARADARQRSGAPDRARRTARSRQVDARRQAGTVARLPLHRARPHGRAGLRRPHPRPDRDGGACDLPPLRARLPRARDRPASDGGDRHRRRHRLERRDLRAAAAPHPHHLDQGAGPTST